MFVRQSPIISGRQPTREEHGLLNRVAKLRYYSYRRIRFSIVAILNCNIKTTKLMHGLILEDTDQTTCLHVTMYHAEESLDITRFLMIARYFYTKKGRRQKG